MFKVELGSDDFYKDSEYVKIGNVAKAIARILLSNDSPNRFQSERDAWPLIHTGIAENKLHPLAPETLDVLSIDNYGNGIVAFSELAEWGVWCHRFNFVKKCAQSASGAKAGEMKALKAKNKARLERAITPQGSVSCAPRVDLPTPLEQPDWDYWPYLPTVKPWQACALALNIEPDSVDYRPKSWDGQPETWDGFPSEVGDHFIKLLQLLVANQFEKQHFTKNFSMGVRLSEFAAWCVHVGFAIPPELSALAASPERPQVAPRVKAVPVTNQNGDHWRVQARAIADECFDRDTANGCRDSLENYSKRVMVLMQERGIKGPRGIFDSAGTIKREALQSKQWWANKAK